MNKKQYIKGDEHYNLIYNNNLEQEAQWLALSAPQKVESIVQLLLRENIKPNSILELGCGTGSVIRECQRRGLAKEYFAVDSSKQALNYLQQNSKNIKTLQADITKQKNYFNQKFDVIILSHVLEHIHDETVFLQFLKANLNYKYLIIEVPLENLFFSRIKNLFRDRTKNAAGHVNFYTSNSFFKLIENNNFQILTRRKYVPVLELTTIDFLAKKQKYSYWNKYLKYFTSHHFPKYFNYFWEKWYYAHLAILCKNS